MSKWSLNKQSNIKSYQLFKFEAKERKRTYYLILSKKVYGSLTEGLKKWLEFWRVRVHQSVPASKVFFTFVTFRWLTYLLYLLSIWKETRKLAWSTFAYNDFSWLLRLIFRRLYTRASRQSVLSLSAVKRRHWRYKRDLDNFFPGSSSG